MESARIVIEVVAGVLPGTPIPELTRRFGVTSQEYYEDKTGEAMMKAYGYAQEYMRSLWNPHQVNWVKCEWLYL